MTNNSYGDDSRGAPNLLIDELLLKGALTLSERNRVHTFLNGTHCWNMPPITRRLSDIEKALQLVRKTRKGALSPQILSIISFYTQNVGSSQDIELVKEKLIKRTREHAIQRENNARIVHLHDIEKVSFPAIGTMFGLTAGHTNTLYVREKRLRALEEVISQTKVSTSPNEAPAGP